MRLAGTKKIGRKALGPACREADEWHHLHPQNVTLQSGRLSIPQLLVEKCKDNITALAKLQTIPCFSRNFLPTAEDVRKWGAYQSPVIFDVHDCVPAGKVPTYEDLIDSCLKETRPAKQREVR
jgi:hypothetical protein